MNYEIVKGKPEDYEDIIDFGNYVFNIDFPALLPKLYKKHNETAQYHYIVKEAHRIKAMVGSFPIGLTVSENHIKGRGIGTVSVHKYSRNSGYMRLLMDQAVADMVAEGCDFAVLSGQRQRYEYWGFTPTGITLNLNFSASNIKHCAIDLKEDYMFIEYDQTITKDLKKAFDLHNSQIVHAVREVESFIEIAKSWNSHVLFVYKNGEFSGYLSVSENYEKILDIVLVSSEEIDKAIISYMRQFKLGTTNVVLPMYRSMEFIKLSRICEYYSIHNSANIKILNYKSVMKAFLSLKNTLSPLDEGLLILEIEDAGRYKIMVKDGYVNVEETELPFDLSLSHLDASALLFSPSCFVNFEAHNQNTIIKSWFPLPLYYPEIDNV